MTTFSVVIPTYDRPKLTIRAIESVAAQGLECEIVVVDDGSPSDSYAALKDSALALERGRPHVTLKLVRNTRNQGVANSRNQGMRLARSEFIGLLDSDDYWLPCHARESIVALTRKKTAVATVSGYYVKSGRKAMPSMTRLEVEDPSEALISGWCPSGMSSIFIAMDRIQGVEFRSSLPQWEDLDFLLSLAKLQGGIIVRPQPTVVVELSLNSRRSDNSATKLAAEELIKTWSDQLGPEELTVFSSTVARLALQHSRTFGERISSFREHRIDAIGTGKTFGLPTVARTLLSVLFGHSVTLRLQSALIQT